MGFFKTNIRYIKIIKFEPNPIKTKLNPIKIIPKLKILQFSFEKQYAFSVKVNERKFCEFWDL